MYCVLAALVVIAVLVWLAKRKPTRASKLNLTGRIVPKPKE